MILMRVPVRLEILWIIPLFLELVALSVSVALFLSALYVRLPRSALHLGGVHAGRLLRHPHPLSADSGPGEVGVASWSSIPWPRSSRTPATS